MPNASRQSYATGRLTTTAVRPTTRWTGPAHPGADDRPSLPYIQRARVSWTRRSTPTPRASQVFISITESKPSFTGPTLPGCRRSLTPSRTATAAPQASATMGIRMGRRVVRAACCTVRSWPGCALRGTGITVPEVTVPEVTVPGVTVPDATVPGGGDSSARHTPLFREGYLTSALITRHRPMASGRISHAAPVVASWTQSWPVKLPSYMRFWLKEKSTQGCAFSNHAWLAASTMESVGTTN